MLLEARFGASLKGKRRVHHAGMSLPEYAVIGRFGLMEEFSTSESAKITDKIPYSRVRHNPLNVPQCRVLSKHLRYMPPSGTCVAESLCMSQYTKTDAFNMSGPT